jgi:predicted nucleic acid-binding Zn ribbon protein
MARRNAMRKEGGVMARKERAHCPICGKYYDQDQEHRCSEKSLAARDAIMKSDHDYRENRKPYGQRLSKGFEMLAKHDDSYMDDDAWENDE